MTSIEIFLIFNLETEEKRELFNLISSEGSKAIGISGLLLPGSHTAKVVTPT